MLSKTHKFTGGEIFHHSNDVLVVKYRIDRKITDHDMLTQRDLRKELIGDVKHYPIIDMTDGVVSFTEGAKAWAAVNEESYKVRICDVLLVKGAAMKFKARFYTMMYKPITNTVIRTSMKDALEFIENHKAANQ